MTPKDDIAQRRADLLKAARSMIRLRHSLAADAELNRVLPQIDKAFIASVQTGTLPEVAALLSEFVAGDK